MLSAACYYAIACCWLRIFIRNHSRRASKFALAGGLIFAIGFGLMYIEVHNLEWNKIAAHCFNTPLMVPIGFALNWFIWRERKTPWGSGVKRYALVTAGTIAGSQSVYALLAGAANMQYLHANIVTAIAVGVPHYFVNDKRVFKREEEIAECESGEQPDSHGQTYDLGLITL